MRAPSYDFTWNNKTLEDLGIRSLIDEIVFNEEIGKFDTATLKIHSASELGYAPDIAKLGSVMQVSFGYYNESILPMGVLFLHAIEPDFAGLGVTLSFMSYLKAMAVNEKDRTLSNRTIKEVVDEVVSDYETLVVGTIDSGDTKLLGTTTQSKKTDFALLEGIAADYGMHWKVEEIPGRKGIWALSLYKMAYDKTSVDNYLPLAVYPEKEFLPETKAIKLSSFKPKSNVLGISSRVEVRSNNPNSLHIVAETEDKDPSKNPTEVSGSEVVMTVFGTVTTVRFNDNVSDEEAASIIAEQLRDSEELAFVVAQDSQCQEGIPNLRVGQTRTIKCKGIPLFEKMFSGAYYITKTKHTMSAQNGYDTSFTANMNSLSVPPPPEASFGGSGGTPVLIRVVHGQAIDNMFGWYVNIDGNGVVSLGATISNEEILANAYWMEHVNASIRFYVGNASAPASGREVIVGQGENADWTNLARFSAGLEGRSTDVRIDWPDEWSTSIGSGSVATSVTQSEAIEAITTVVDGVSSFLNSTTDWFYEDNPDGRQGVLPTGFAEDLAGAGISIGQTAANLIRTQGGGI